MNNNKKLYICTDDIHKYVYNGIIGVNKSTDNVLQLKDIDNTSIKLNKYINYLDDNLKELNNNKSSTKLYEF